MCVAEILMSGNQRDFKLTNVAGYLFPSNEAAMQTDRQTDLGAAGVSV